MITTVPRPRTTSPWDPRRALTPSLADSSDSGSSSTAKTYPPPCSDGASAEPSRSPAPPPTPPPSAPAPADAVEHVQDCAAGALVGGDEGKGWDEILGSNPEKAASDEEARLVVKCVVCLVGGDNKRDPCPKNKEIPSLKV
jgi:hypothetical protein